MTVFFIILCEFVLSLFIVQPKCYKYWPSKGGKAYGNIVVRVDRDIILPFYTIRSFKLIDVSKIQRKAILYTSNYVHISHVL